MIDKKKKKNDSSSDGSDSEDKEQTKAADTKEVKGGSKKMTKVKKDNPKKAEADSK